MYAQLHPSLTNGLALYNPNKRTILEGPTAKLTDVSSIIGTLRKRLMHL